MKNIKNMMKKYNVERDRVIHSNYNSPKETKELEKLHPNLFKNISDKLGKYHYLVNGISVVRLVPLKPIGTKNWLLKDKAKLTPYYEIFISNDKTPKFWHFKDVVEFIIKYRKGQVDEYYYKDEIEDY